MQNSSIKKIGIIGPESTGKSTLARFLATKFNTCWVKEYARAYLDGLSRPYRESDLVYIARGQAQEETRLLPTAKRILICDTTPMVIKIWSEVKYGRCHNEILKILERCHYSVYLLTYFDIPWEADPKREHPHQREYLWKMYEQELQAQKVPYVEIRGSHQQRKDKAVQAITQLIHPALSPGEG